MSIYKELSEKRKESQKNGETPEWYTTAGFQLFSEKYSFNGCSVKERFYSIAETASKYIKDKEEFKNAKDEFFNLLWKGWLSPSTPILANAGTNRGLVVSCSGSYIDDSIDGFYTSRREGALLTKYGFGTSAYLGAIRPRGSIISNGGRASGVLPVFKGFVQDSKDVSQGNCYHPQTEVLTILGFKTFKEAKSLNIPLIQVNEYGISSVTNNVEWVEQEYNGNLIHFKDSKNIDILVSPNHRMFYKKRKRKTNKKINNKFISNEKIIDEVFTIKEAENCPTHRDVYFNNSIINYNNNNDKQLTWEERFLIAFQADGSYIRKGKVNACTFHFNKPSKIERLQMILDNCKYEYTKNLNSNGTTNFYVKIKPISKTFDWIDFENINSAYARSFVEEVSLWDGSISNRSDNKLSFDYISINKINIDIIQALCSLCGFKSRTRTIQKEGNRQLQYQIYCSDGELFGGENVQKNIINYSGNLYCAVVPSGGLIVRSQGHTLICGNTRRGSWAGYIEITHGDYDEIADFVLNDPDNANIGWIITDDFINGLNNGNEEYIRRYQKALKLKMVTGRGYFCFTDKINRKRPECYIKNELYVKASNLCDEICLTCDKDHTFTCVLSSMNVSKYDEWKNTNAVYWATVFLDCIAEDFIQNGKHIKGLENAVRFTEKSRALGLGQCGFHTYLQKNMIPFESLEASFLNKEIAKHINDQSLYATKHLASVLGEPEWCTGFAIRNSHRIAIAPTKSTALLMGGISEGINPDPAMAFNQTSAGGEMDRINPILIDIMKERGTFNKKTISEIKDKMGSVQHITWLSDKEKSVFKTAFEINQEVIIRLASQRANYIDQWQSLNLFFSANENEEWISKIHRMAFEDENILGLYYIYSQAGVQASKDCEACM